jgi:hypothetical protein
MRFATVQPGLRSSCFEALERLNSSVRFACGRMLSPSLDKDWCGSASVPVAVASHGAGRRFMCVAIAESELNLYVS